ncbi:MAG: putative transport system permease protein, partial [Bryobacterales bacterium]|nr:putative transport system permease protein [Bryobacterales bacterium]
HLDLATDEFIQKGMTAEEARRMALVKLGGLEQSKEVQRDARGLPLLDTLAQDFRYAVRTLRREAGFAVFTILIIGLGVGASATVFSVVNSLLVRPLPFKDPDRLVWVANKTDKEGNMSAQTVQVGPLMELRERNQSFSDIAGYFAFYGVGDVSLTGQGEPERLSAIPVSQTFFPLLGVQPIIGRQFTDEECKWNGPKAALLTYGFWERRYAKDPGIVGKTVRMDDAPVTVVGVMPASFDFGAIFAPGTHADLFTPFALSKETNRWGNTMALVGRLKPGAGLGAAQAEGDILGTVISDSDKNRNSFHPRLTMLREHVSGQMRPALWILGCAVGVVMLIVCANLSNLMLARTAARQKEMAIRAAMGAGRRRLIRQLLTESLVLTSCGALLGLVLTFASTQGIAHLTAVKLPLLSSVQVDARVLGFTLLVAMGTGLLLGIAPALQVSGLRLNASLGQRSASDGQEHAWLRGSLVVSEIAFACVLLVGAGLLIRSFVRVLDVRLGFQPERAATLRIDPNSEYKTQAQKNGYLTEALHRARNIPGVESAGLVDSLPLGKNRTWGAGAKGRDYKRGEYPLAFVRMISDGYLRAMGMQIRRGRDLTEHDGQDDPPVMLINETMARTLWPGQDPIGQLVTRSCGKDREVVGVVEDVRHIALEKESGSEMYLPIRQCPDYGSWDLVVRSRLPLAALSSGVQASLRPIAPDLPKAGMRPLTQLVDQAVSPRRFILLLLTGFAGFALLLASLGIYGLISYSVNRRTQEIGIRMALGASTFDVQSRIVMTTIGLAAAGMLVGVVASLGLARSVSGMLFGVTYGDPVTFVAAGLTLLTIAVLAGYLPARKASKIDPMICLRAN